jgi:hypothetical protein
VDPILAPKGPPDGAVRVDITDNGIDIGNLQDGTYSNYRQEGPTASGQASFPANICFSLL